jgi:hypothetical protein
MARKKISETLDQAIRRCLSSRPVAYIASGLTAMMMQRRSGQWSVDAASGNSAGGCDQKRTRPINQLTM